MNKGRRNNNESSARKEQFPTEERKTMRKKIKKNWKLEISYS